MDSLTLAREALQVRDYVTAEKLFREHLRLEPKDTEVRLELAMACYLAGDLRGFQDEHALASRGSRVSAGNRLFALQRKLVERIGRAAAIVGLATAPLAVAGCEKSPKAQTAPVHAEGAGEAGEPLPAGNAGSAGGQEQLDMVDEPEDLATDSSEQAQAEDAVDAVECDPCVSECPGQECEAVAPAEPARPPLMKYGIKRPPKKRYMAKRP